MPKIFFGSLQEGGLRETVKVSYGHTTVKAPHPIRTAKLSTVGPDQYYGRGLRGNLRCCKAFFLQRIKFFLEIKKLKLKKIRRGRFELPTKGWLRLRTLQSSALPLSYLRTISGPRIRLCNRQPSSLTTAGGAGTSPR